MVRSSMVRFHNTISSLKHYASVGANQPTLNNDGEC